MPFNPHQLSFRLVKTLCQTNNTRYVIYSCVYRVENGTTQKKKQKLVKSVNNRFPQNCWKCDPKCKYKSKRMKFQSKLIFCHTESFTINQKKNGCTNTIFYYTKNQIFQFWCHFFVLLALFILHINVLFENHLFSLKTVRFILFQ